MGGRCPQTHRTPRFDLHHRDGSSAIRRRVGPVPVRGPGRGRGQQLLRLPCRPHQRIRPQWAMQLRIPTGLRWPVRWRFVRQSARSGGSGPGRSKHWQARFAKLVPVSVVLGAVGRGAKPEPRARHGRGPGPVGRSCARTRCPHANRRCSDYLRVRFDRLGGGGRRDRH